MADTTKSDAKPGDLEAQIAEMRAEIARLARLLGERGAADAGQDGGEPLREQARHRVEDAAVSLERYIAEKPVQSAMVALLAGLVLGLLTRR